MYGYNTIVSYKVQEMHNPLQHSYVASDVLFSWPLEMNYHLDCVRYHIANEGLNTLRSRMAVDILPAPVTEIFLIFYRHKNLDYF